MYNKCHEAHKAFLARLDCEDNKRHTSHPEFRVLVETAFRVTVTVFTLARYAYIDYPRKITATQFRMRAETQVQSSLKACIQREPPLVITVEDEDTEKSAIDITT